MHVYFSGGHYPHITADITPTANNFKKIFGIDLEFDTSAPFSVSMANRCIPVKLPQPAPMESRRSKWDYLGIPKPSTPLPDPKDIDFQGQDSEGRKLLIQQIIPTYGIYNHAQAGTCECGNCKYFASYQIEIVDADNQRDLFKSCSVHTARYKTLLSIQ